MGFDTRLPPATVQLKSDYFRIEMKFYCGYNQLSLELKSDYFRIEISLLSQETMVVLWLKSDYFRIEIFTPALN